MRQSVIIIASIIIIGLLAVRSLVLHRTRVREERKWYITHLNYDFSATVDSVGAFRGAGSGWVYFHIVGNSPDLYEEDRLNAKLKYARSLRFVRRKKYILFFLSFNINKYQKGDSIVINSAADKISVFRSDTLTYENKISPSIGGG